MLKSPLIKRVAIAFAAALGVLLAGYGALRAQAQTPSHDADRQALRAILADYEQALNQDQFAKISQHLGSGFSATMATGQKVQSVQEFEDYWKAMKDLIGIGQGKQGRYQVEMKPIDTFFVSDYAASFGTSNEELRTDIQGKAGRESKHYRFNSMWFALSKKDGNGWKVVGGHIVVDPFRSTFSEAKVQEINKYATAKLGK